MRTPDENWPHRDCPETGRLIQTATPAELRALCDHFGNPTERPHYYLDEDEWNVDGAS